MATFTPPNDTKELRQALVNKKEERLNLIYKMGESVHKQALHNAFQHEGIHKISQDILQKDKEIYQLAQEMTKQINSQGNCSKCQQPISNDIKFCGNCGTLNPLFEDQQSAKASCSSCGEKIPAGLEYCPCCGVKQEAM